MGRVVVVSFSGGRPTTSRALNFEREDVLLASTPNAVRMAVDSPPCGRIPRWRRAARRFGLSPLAASSNGVPGGPIDLLIVNCMSPRDLFRVPGLRQLLRRADRSICYLTEIWSHSAGSFIKATLEAFDVIATACATSVQPIAATIGRPVLYSAPAVDALAWAAPARDPARLIDVFLFGRKHMPWHHALARDSAEHEYFYLFDTVHAVVPIDLAEHRAKFRELNQRSRINIVNIAKVNRVENRGTDEELGFRYFEAAAAGCALVGYRPASPHWTSLFGWPESLIEVPLNDPDALLDAVHELLNDPARVAAISRRNRAESLLRHDAVYRWEELLEAAGVPVPAAMQQRKRLLAESAAAIAAEPGRMPPDPAHGLAHGLA